jgi:inhibitor of the pro-sigma K processing machinery
LDPIIIISVVVGLIVFLLLFGTALKPVRFAGRLAVKLLVGGLLLFFLNILGTNFGLHVPINAITTVVAGLLGIPGIAALAVIKTFLL